MKLVVQMVENDPFSLLIVILTEGFVSVTLVTVEVGYVLIQLHSLTSQNQGSRTPEFLVLVEILSALVEVQSEGKGLRGEGKLVADRIK